MIDSQLLSFLRCPVDGSALQPKGDLLVSQSGREYPVVEGVPVLLPSGIPETIGYAEKSLQAARVTPPVDPFFLATVGISDEERSGVRQLARQGDNRIDPVVSYLVGATSGTAYRHLIGKLQEYPIPEFRLSTSVPKLLLDLGCNWGRWCFAAARMGFTPVGIDPQLGALLAAQRVARKLGLRCHFVCADARYLPFAAETFDLVFSYSVLQHLSPENVEIVLGQAAGTMRTNGEVFIQMPNRFGLLCFAQQIKRGFRPARGFEVRYWSLGDLRRIFGRHFNSVEFEVDCYFGIGLQAADAKYMRPLGAAAIKASEFLRKSARQVKGLMSIADSVYVHARMGKLKR